MQKKYVVIGAIAVLLIGIAVIKIVLSRPSADARRAVAPLVKVGAPTRQTLLYTLQLNGDVLPIQQAAIYSKVQGNLDRNFVEMGMDVRANQLLAVIDSTELYQQYQQASATFINNRLIFQRNKELLERNLISHQDLDNAEAAMKVAQANFEAAATRLSYARIVAPFSGVITKRYLDAGALVTPTNSILFNLMTLDSVKIVVNVLEKDVPLVPRVKKATVTLDALPGYEFTGVVANYSQAVDLATRTMAVEIHVPNKNRFLKPGMFATVSLLLNEKRDALTVPTSALLRNNDDTFVYVVDNRSAKRVRVNIGIEQHGQTEILSGLTGNEDLITVGQQFVKEGGPVSIQQ